MDKMKIEAIDVLDRIIIGRVDPHIYAFTTNTVPNYLKVGDTYRPVSQRLNEWRVFFPELEKQYENKAVIDEETYFRDYAIHQYLENDLNKKRLKPEDLEDDIYYSREFFKGTETGDIDNAIEDIKKSYQANSSKYEYYSSKNRLPQTFHYQRGEQWTLRPNQADAVKAFVNAVNNGRKNLLMYAVMRFGKSFTSLCCALEISANIVLVVSAKADVKDEWKKTVEGAGNFSKYVFLEAYDLASSENAIKANRKENKFENIVNYRIEVKEKNGKVMFLRNIIKGGADRSYGIEVAKLAGLPKEILKESREILHRLEQRKELIEKTINVKQLSLFGQIAEIDREYEEKTIDVVENERDEKIDEVIFDIENKDINNITPMEALKFLSEIKAKLEEKK